VLLAFVDEEVSGLLGIGEPEEYPLALVTLQAPAVAEATGSSPLKPISPRTWPLSHSPRSYPLVTAAKRLGDSCSCGARVARRLLAVGDVRLLVGPFLCQGAVEPLHFAVGLGPVGAGEPLGGAEVGDGWRKAWALR
jgi:hypothetical protein